MKITPVVVGMVATNCYIVSDGDGGDAVIIDPGGGAEAILSKAEGLNVRKILLTHGHFDHILAVKRLRGQLKAPVYIHGDDAEYLTDPAKSLSGLMSESQGAADVLLNDGDIIDAGTLKFEVIHTPGHTPGSVVFRTGSVMFTGDTLFEGGCGRCDLPGGDYGTLLKSLRRLYDLPGDLEIFPGHGGSSALDIERRRNFAMLEAAAL